jgi:predicted esterase
VKRLRLHARQISLAVATHVVTGLLFAPIAAAEPTPKDQWCAPELTAITDTVCFHAPAAKTTGDAPAGRTLVIFLHSLTGDGSSWAWEQQRLMKRHADRHGFSALIPRGRPGLGPGRDPNVLAWPTAQVLQEQHEEALLAEWTAARGQVESTAGPFARVFVFGFSNGAYYATSLALRGKLPVDGYGVFAGGNGGKYHKLLSRSARHRAPVFVGYGSKDPDHPRQQNLIRLLGEIAWPHASRVDRIGHTVSDAQIREALAFLGAGDPQAER